MVTAVRRKAKAKVKAEPQYLNPEDYPEHISIGAMIRPWRMPANIRPTEDMTTEELQIEARRMRPLLRGFGWRDSAVFRPVLATIQYRRLVEYAGILGIAPFVWYYFIVLMGAVFPAIAFWAFAEFVVFADQQAVIHSDRNPLAGENGALYSAGFAFVIGFAFGFPTAYMTLASMMFKKVYADTVLAQKPIEGDRRGRATIARWVGSVMRMAFVHDETMDVGTRFSGTDGHDGFLNGSLYFETEENVGAIQDPREIYTLVKRRRSDFVGGTTSERHSRRTLALEAGKLNALKLAARNTNGGFGDWLNKNKALVFMLIAAGIAILVLMVGWTDISSIQSVVTG